MTHRLAIPTASVHREVDRAERAGIVRSRRVGRTRLVSADTTNPHFESLRHLLVGTFGVPARLSRALSGIHGVNDAYIFGSWAARWHGERGSRPVGDIDVLVLGEPDRSELYGALHEVGLALGREIQPLIRPAGWLASGSGSFHETVTSRPLVAVHPLTRWEKSSDTSATAR